MKTVFLITVLLLLCACQTSVEMASPDSSEHIGCQENEIDKDGNCFPAEKSDSGLFGQNLDSYVDSEDIQDGVYGFVAKPKSPGVYPGIVMVHEWWGLNGHIKEMAKILAKEGYVVFAVDLYHGKVASDADSARELVSKARASPEHMLQDMRQALHHLKEVHGVTRVGSLGWCFGGGQSLQLSLHEDLDATVMYYGSLVTDEEQLKDLQSPLLGIFGELDGGIPLTSVNEFTSALDALHIENEIHVYPDVGHAFANPSGGSYAEQETKDAWQKTLTFLEKHLKSE